MKDWVLITWLIVDFLMGVFLLAGSIYLVIWKGCSGWWIVLALILGSSPSLYAALKIRYKIKEDT